MPKQCCKTPCNCRGCGCPTCPNALSQLNLKDPSYVCDHGTRPECGCTTNKRKPEKPTKPCSSFCDLDEPEPIPDPERIQSLLNVLTYEAGCICKVVTRAVRGDVHRYLGLERRPPTPVHPPEDDEYCVNSTCTNKSNNPPCFS